MFEEIINRYKDLLVNRTFVFKDTTEERSMKYLTDKTTFVGASAYDVQSLEGLLNITFCEEYRSFLQQMGRNTGGFLAGNDVYLLEEKAYLYGRDCVLEIIEENNIESEFSSDCLVFSDIQGVDFFYQNMHTNAVYRINESAAEEFLIADSLKTYFFKILDIMKSNAQIQLEYGGNYLTVYENGMVKTFGSEFGDPKPLEVGDVFVKKGLFHDASAIIKKIKKQMGMD